MKSTRVAMSFVINNSERMLQCICFLFSDKGRLEVYRPEPPKISGALYNHNHAGNSLRISTLNL